MIVLPGGFSYGDYLRSGAIARFSPIMQEVAAFAQKGGPVFGVCNGFQVLCEAGLLPGVLLHNEGQTFLCKNVFIRAENRGTLLTNAVIAYNTWKLDEHLEARRRAGRSLPSDEILAHIAPIAFGHINFRGIYRFPLERYVDRLVPSMPAAQKAVGE